MHDQDELKARIFAGVFSTGISYADRLTEEHGDYKRLAFLPFSTLKLEIENDCSPELRSIIAADAAGIQARRGQTFQISSSGNQSVRLGVA